MYVSYMYNVTISYLSCKKKKQERGLILIKVYGYIIFQFSSLPHFFFLLLSTKYQVFCLFSMSVFCCMTCFADFKLLSRLRVGCSEGDYTWKVWGLPFLILQENLLSLFK